jgi:WhiB family redox-sensing transcriptional regulator
MPALPRRVEPPQEREPMSWKDLGACLGSNTNLWFPGKGEDTHKAISICCQCPVVTECLQYALAHQITTGVWGGISSRGRSRMRQARRLLQKNQEVVA